MKGDFTRWTFRQDAHYHGVLKQQGRVDVDSDWNEQNAITSHRVETETRDVIGGCGAPAGAPGFLLTPGPKGATLMIAKGRAYVDGILIENETDVAIDAQPDLPGVPLPTQPGYYLAYLEVFERHVTMLDDPEIREVALGGPDTCTRAKTVWQVKLLADKGPFECSSRLAGWDALIAPVTGTLAARAEPDPAAADPCTIPVKAGYRRLENQLYRVEIHNGGPTGQATFKWSRENGSIVAAVTAWPNGSGELVTVSSIGRDAVLGFAAGEWVEVSDDTHEFQFLPGTLARILKIDGDTLTLDKSTATGSLDPKDFPVKPKVRRWESVANGPALTKTTNGTWLNLESGVQVQFGGATHSTGDYWMIPARTLTADIDWPVQGGNPVAQLPKGIRRHYCRLAVVQFQGGVWTVVASCLPVFRPLGGSTAPTRGIHVTGVNLVAGSTSTPLDNDAAIPITSLRNAAIEVVLDQPVNPICARPPACFVTVDLPFPPATGTGAPPPLIGAQTIVLNDDVLASPAGIRLTMTNEALNYLTALLNGPVVNRVLARVTLKGAKIWSASDPLLYLDGVAFGTAKGDLVGLRLPGGAGRPGSDFEMWFWLTGGTVLGVNNPAGVNTVPAAQPKAARKTRKR
jgi:hypothetical protein